MCLDRFKKPEEKKIDPIMRSFNEETEFSMHDGQLGSCLSRISDQFELQQYELTPSLKAASKSLRQSRTLYEEVFSDLALNF